MKLPKLEKPEKYVGLYILDFGDGSTLLTTGHCGVGFTAEEVAELLESELYGDCKVYKIHRAYPDGRLELKGVRREIFQLEAGMFFYSADIQTARDDYKRLVKLGIECGTAITWHGHPGRESKSTHGLEARATWKPVPQDPAVDSGSPCHADIPCRAKVQLAKYNDDKFAAALIYPAEYDDEISGWLSANNYKTTGAAEGGTDAVSRYYDEKPEILERHQLWPKSSLESRTGKELLASIKVAVQR